jgi:hypothetical protein
VVKPVDRAAAIEDQIAHCTHFHATALILMYLHEVVKLDAIAFI